MLKNTSSLINSYLATVCLIAAHKLDLFRILRAQPRTEKEIIALTQARDINRLRAILYYLGQHQIIDFHNHCYQLNSTSLDLADESKPYPYLLDLIAEQYLPALLNMNKAIATDATAFELTFGENSWQHRFNHPHLEHKFKKFMDAETAYISDSIVSQWVWSNYASIIDIGGGKGALANCIAKKHPSVRVSVFDRFNNVSENGESSNDANLLHEVIMGDFFKEIPNYYDLYILKSILHDWNDEDSAKILINLKNTINKTNGKILIIERVLNKPNNAGFSVNNDVTLDLNLLMSAIHGSCERSEIEFKELFASSGLQLISQKKLSNGFYIFELSSEA